MVVSGDKAVEVALSEGFFPVVNKESDIFAVPSVSGKCLFSVNKCF